MPPPEGERGSHGAGMLLGVAASSYLSPIGPLLLLVACEQEPTDKAPAETGAAPDSSGGPDSSIDTDSDAPPTAASIELVMQQVLPLLALDESVTIDVTLGGTEALLAEGWTAVDIQLVGTASDGTEVEFERTDGVSLAEGAVAVVHWTPSAVGRSDLSARASVEGWTVGESADWRIAVTPDRVHVHHWYADLDDHHWVSALLAPSGLVGTVADDETWLSRGAQTLQWKGDEWATDDPVAYAGYLVDELGDTVTGFVVDEMLDGSAHDQIVGQALRLVQEEYPELYVTPYFQWASGEDMIAALAASDLALVEVFPNDFREYEGYGGRLQQAIDVGLEDHTLAVLSLYEATHEAELRQQVLYFRSHYPDLPGIAFFGNPASIALRAAMDTIIEEAFLAPALVVEVSGSTATVRNIGGEDAADVRVSFLVGDGSLADEADLGDIAAGDIAAATTAEDFDDVVLSAAEGVTLLVWTDPREVEPDAGAAEAWWSVLVAGASETEVLAGRPDLDEQYSGSHLTHATLPLGNSTSFGLEAGFELVDATIYGVAGIGVQSSEASLLLSLYRGEYDNDLGSQDVRATFTWTSPAAVEVTSLVPVGLTPGVYTFRMGFDATSVRAVILDAAGSLVADTGSLAIDGPFAPDELVLDVRDEGPSEVAWDDSGDERVRLHGGVSTAYYVDGWVSQVTAYSP